MDHRTTTVNPPPQHNKLHRSIFELPLGLLDSCRLVKSPSTYGAVIADHHTAVTNGNNTHKEEEDDDGDITNGERVTCNTCNSTFGSFQDQRSHFNSDLHRVNAKLALVGKDTLKEDEFDGTSDCFVADYEISSISGSDDESEKNPNLHEDMNKESLETQTKVFVRLANGDVFSVWKCMFVDESVKILFEQDKCGGSMHQEVTCITEWDMVERLRNVVHEPRDKSHLRVILLASGGHFAGCVFDGDNVVVHQTLHRYRIRAKSGMMKSSKDASAIAAASVRQDKDLALKKEIRELLAAWKPFFDDASSIFIHAPSSSRLLLFDNDTPSFSCQNGAIRYIPLTVRRPTFKEAQRVYSILTQFSREATEGLMPIHKEDSSTTHEGLPSSNIKNLEKGGGGASIANGMEGVSISNANKVEVTQKASSTESQSSIPEMTTESEAAQLKQASSTQSQSRLRHMTKDEKLKEEQNQLREKCAVAAERRIAALQSSNSYLSQPSSFSKASSAGDNYMVDHVMLQLNQKRILVETFNGRMITLLRAEGLQDALDIKDVFYEIPPNRQLLTINGEELDSMKSLQSFLKYAVTNIRMKLNTSIEILVQKSNGIIEAAYVDTISSVRTAKERIQNRIGLLAQEFELCCCGEFLDPERYIRDYNIFPGSVMHAVVHGPWERSDKTIILQTCFGEEYPMQMTPDTTVADVESFILQREELNIHGHKMYYHGQRLVGTHKLSTYHIEDFGIIRIVEEPSETIPVEIYIDFREVLSGEEDEFIKTVTLEVVPGAHNLSDLRTMIKEKFHIPIDKQKVFLPLIPLDSLKSTLGEYDICHGSRISVISTQMRIYIKYAEGTFAVRINGYDTVCRLKRKIQDRKGIHRDFQVLTFFEEELEDARTLLSYRIDWNFTLTLSEK